MRVRLSTTSIVVTEPPGSMPSPSGTMASASANDVAASWWLPWAPTERDVVAPVGAERAGDAHVVRLAVGSAAQARRRRRPGPSGRSSSVWPIILRSAGRANSSKLTIELTGLPGRPNTGTRRSTPTSSRPKANGLAGLMAICIQRMSAIRDSTAFTTSYSPMLTPPLVTIASYDRRPSRSTVLERGLVVAHHTEVDRRRNRPRRPTAAASSCCSRGSARGAAASRR